MDGNYIGLSFDLIESGITLVRKQAIDLEFVLVK